MDNLGDWLYILILIAVGISSLFSSSKKKKQTGQAPQQPVSDPGHEEKRTQQPKSFWEILEDMQRGIENKEEQPLPVPQSITTEKKKKTQEKKQVKTSVIPSHYNEGTRAIKDTLSGQPRYSADASEEEAYALSGESFHSIDELKKAIIYSEILNRKY